MYFHLECPTLLIHDLLYHSSQMRILLSVTSSWQNELLPIFKCSSVAIKVENYYRLNRPSIVYVLQIQILFELENNRQVTENITLIRIFVVPVTLRFSDSENKQ